MSNLAKRGPALLFDYKGDDDGTWERLERLSRKEVISRAIELFTSSASFSWPKETKAFNCMKPPPQVTILTCIVQLSITEQGTDLLMQRSIRRTEQYIFQTCRELNGRQRWTSDHQKTLKKVPSVSHQNPEIRMLIIRCVPPVIGEISGKTGSGRRAGPEEEENGSDRSPQTGRYITRR